MAETIEKVLQLKKHLERYFEREDVEEKVRINNNTYETLIYLNHGEVTNVILRKTSNLVKILQFVPLFLMWAFVPVVTKLIECRKYW